MRLLVTGGTGFVGRHFIGAALAAGHQITALSRPGRAPADITAPAFRWLEAGLDTCPEASLAGHDVLVHLAAHTANHPYDSLEQCLLWNVTVPLRLFAAAHRAGVTRQIAAGSCFEYGRAAERHALLFPNTPLEPVGSYPISKAAASVALGGQARDLGSRLSILRIFQVYGPGEQPTRFWPLLRAAAHAGRDFPMSPGAQVRDFIPVEDVAREFVRELDRTVPAGTPVIRHVATGQAQTLLEFAQHWWKTWGARGSLRPGAQSYRDRELMRLVSAPPGE